MYTLVYLYLSLYIYIYMCIFIYIYVHICVLNCLIRYCSLTSTRPLRIGSHKESRGDWKRSAKKKFTRVLCSQSLNIECWRSARTPRERTHVSCTDETNTRPTLVGRMHARPCPGRRKKFWRSARTPQVTWSARTSPAPMIRHTRQTV